MNLNKKTVLIIVIIILISSLGIAFGYMYISGQKNSVSPVNQTALNQTVQNGTSIAYSSEYITFDKAKSIAKSKVGKGVVVGDPILIKDKSGKAIYVVYYSYNGYYAGGIIINAKTGAILYRELNIPSEYTDTTNNNDQNYYDTNYDNYYDNSNYDNSDYNDQNYDDTNYDDSNSNDSYNDDTNYDDSSNDDSSNDDTNYDDSNSDDSYYDDSSMITQTID